MDNRENYKVTVDEEEALTNSPEKTREEKEEGSFEE